MQPEPKVILIPRMPSDVVLDFVFKTDKGIGVRASMADIAELQARNIPFVELFASSNEYAAVMSRSSRGQAIAAIESIQDTRLAALAPGERNQFDVA